MTRMRNGQVPSMMLCQSGHQDELGFGRVEPRVLCLDCYEQSRFSCLELLVSCILLLFLSKPCNDLDTRRHPLKHELF